jgi:hypothetical protein
MGTHSAISFIFSSMIVRALILAHRSCFDIPIAERCRDAFLSIINAIRLSYSATGKLNEYLVRLCKGTNAIEYSP